MPELPKIIEQTQSTEIEPDDITYLVEEMTKRREAGDEVNFFTQIGILADRYGAQSPKPFAITERMQCLIKLMEADDRMRGWTMDGVDPGCKLTHVAVFKATARTPLHFVNEQFQFDRDEFFQIALFETPTDQVM